MIYGFFSEKAAQKYGHMTFTTPNGSKVDVTVISSDPEGSEYMWDDKIKMGVVLDYVRTVEPVDGQTRNIYKKEIY